MSDIRPEGHETPSHTPSSCEAETRRSAMVVDHPARSIAPLRADPSRPPSAMSEVEAVADYIAQLSTELARLADGQRLAILSYFLDMAAAEARAVAMAGRGR